jgi:uncharacterized metal-binding protein
MRLDTLLEVRDATVQSILGEKTAREVVFACGERASVAQMAMEFLVLCQEALSSRVRLVSLDVKLASRGCGSKLGWMAFEC